MHGPKSTLERPNRLEAWDLVEGTLGQWRNTQDEGVEHSGWRCRTQDAGLQDLKTELISVNLWPLMMYILGLKTTRASSRNVSKYFSEFKLRINNRSSSRWNYFHLDCVIGYLLSIDGRMLTHEIRCLASWLHVAAIYSATHRHMVAHQTYMLWGRWKVNGCHGDTWSRCGLGLSFWEEVNTHQITAA